MKKAVVAMIGFLFIIVAALIGFTIQGRTARQTELENALTSSMEKTMLMLSEQRKYAPATDEEMVAFFMEAMAVQIESSSKLTVNILEADVEKGILSAEGILTYKHPIGTEGDVTCKKTIILEQYRTGTDKDGVAIQYLAEGKVFKFYTLSIGSAFINPGIPTAEGKTFSHWESPLGNGSFAAITNGKTVEESVTFVAKFN